jgi:hypothetical protein
MSSSTSSIAREGGCLCGALRYQITGDALFLNACHCTDCQRSTGAAFGMSLILPKVAFKLLRGSPRIFTKTFADDSRQKFNNFCSDCGVRISTEFSKNPEIVNVKPGTLDDTSWLSPVAHIWRRSAQSWFNVPEGVLCYDQQPTDFTVLLQAWAAQSAK